MNAPLDVKYYKQGAMKINFLEEITVKIIFTKTPLFEGIHQNNLFNVRVPLSQQILELSRKNGWVWCFESNNEHVLQIFILHF